MSTSACRLSVIVPTYNRANMLRDVLHGLTTQDADPAAYEVVVVDDGSTDDTASVVAAFVDGEVAVRYVGQPNEGLNAARNHGVRCARGSLIAFLDDDVWVPASYVTAVVAGFDATPDAAVLAGRVLADFETQPPRWLTPGLAEYLSLYDAGDQPGELSAADYPRGANFAARAEVLAAVGGFRAGLDRRGRSLVSNGEVELFRRVQATGGKGYYWPAATVRHRVPADRLTREFFLRRAAAQGVSDALTETGGGRAHATRLVAREVVRAGRVVPILGKGVATGRGTVTARVWLAYCRGRAVAAAKGGA